VQERSLLVLGARGFLGPHLVHAARRAGWHVSGSARRPGGGPIPPGGCADEVHAFDALERGALERLLDAARPEVVVLSAAMARVHECENDSPRAFALNAELPAELARRARARGLRLVHLSTDLVFGARPPASERYDEDDPPSPVHAYGRTKAEGEALVLAEHPEALVVRLPLLYGDSFGRGLGASDQVLTALERGERPTLFLDEWRTPLEAGNAAEAVVELAGGAARGLLHVAGPARLSRFELAGTILAARGAQGAALAERIRAATRSALGLERSRPRDVSLDARRARELLATPLLAPREALARGRS
jgi:dTDP-4-dehydrorhamnose reductase